MKVHIKATLPDEAGVRTSLVVTVDHAFVQAVLAAEQQLAGARQRLEDCGRELDRIRHGITRGERTVPELEDGLRTRDAAALLIEPAERALADAQEAQARADAAAKRVVIEHAGRIRDGLQAAVDNVRPMLEHVKAIESALDDCVRAADGNEVEAVTWPMSVVDDVSARNAGLQQLATAQHDTAHNPIWVPTPQIHPAGPSAYTAVNK